MAMAVMILGRCLVETAFSRLKRRFVESFKNRRLNHQKTEIALRCKLLSHFTSLGMPQVQFDNPLRRRQVIQEALAAIPAIASPDEQVAGA